MTTTADSLRKLTQARIGLKRAGDTLATEEWLRLQWAHAEARDAVHTAWDVGKLEAALVAAGDPVTVVRTEAASRAEFLLRPDRGRRVPAAELAKLAALRGGGDVLFCVSDGLSSAAVERHFLPLWAQLRPALRSAKFRVAPLVLIPFGRVASADPVGEALGAKISVIALGERPGMSASDSLGLYLTFGPKPGRNDAERNCLSNIRPPDGMGYETATKKVLYLLHESLRRQLSGVALKDESALPAK